MTVDFITTEACKKAVEENLDVWKMTFKKQITKKAGFDFVIMDIMGRNMVCAWRNSYTGKVGRSFLCRRTIKNGKVGFIYKDKFYELDGYGWVI